jgi:Heliorhodopsin
MSKKAIKKTVSLQKPAAKPAHVSKIVSDVEKVIKPDLSEINNSDSRYDQLRTWNLVMAFLHLIQGSIMFFIAKTRLQDFTISLPKPDIAKPSFDLVSEKWFEINLGQTIAGFLLLSAAAHFITVLPGVFQWYKKNLKLEINYIRWYEYALSSSVMVVVIAALCGITDGPIIVLLFSLNAMMNLFGLLMEKENSWLKQFMGKNYKTDWTAFVFGTIAGIIPWIIMGTYFFVSLARLGEVSDLPENVKNTLNTVRFIFPALFIFFNLFAINMVLQYKGIGKWKDYLFGEKAYVILSLVAKSFLAWFIFGGTLRP